MLRKSSRSGEGRGKVGIAPRSLHLRSGVACLATLAELLLIVAVATVAFVFMGTLAIPVEIHSPAAAAVSEDSIKRLFATEDGQIWIRRGNSEIVRFDTKDRTSRSVFPWNDRPVTEFCVSNDGKTWVLAIEEREVMIFRDERLIASEELPPELPAKTAISGDGQIVVSLNEGASCRCWDLSNSSGAISDLPLTEPADRLSLDQHGTRLLVASTLGNLQIYDPKTGTLIQSIPGVGLLSAQGRFTSDGEHVVLVSGHEVSLYALQSGKRKWKTMMNGTEYLRELMVSLDDRYIAVSGVASALYVLDRGSGRIMRNYVDRQNFCGISFSPRGDAVYSGGSDGSIWAWPLNDERLMPIPSETRPPCRLN